MVADVVDVKQSINDHEFTVEWLLNSLRENDETFKKLHGNRPVKEVTAVDVSKGKGFASEILRCTLTFTDSKDDSDVYTTVLKVPGLKSYKEMTAKSGGKAPLSENEAFKKLAAVHNFECNFYTELAPILDVPIPKVYKTVEWNVGENEGGIHMEDLTKRGKIQLYFESVNLTQVKAVIRHLAHMHKNILSAEPEKWQGKFLKNQHMFVDTVANVKPMVEPFLKMCKREDAFRPLIDKYSKFAESKDYYLYVTTQAYKDLNLKPVIVHGDMHFGNIMWAIDNNGDFQNEVAAFVDWQIIHEGSPMSDLARFLTFSADGVTRRQAEEFAIDYYLECLTKEFGGDASKVPYTAENLKRAYKLAFLTQVFVLVGVTVFFFSASDDKSSSKAVKDAWFDQAVLKALHGYEDVDRILQGDLSDMFEKYGV